MEKKYNFKTYLGFVVLFFYMMGTYAQGLPGFGDDVDDEVAAAPIDSLLYMSILVGVIIGLISLKKITKF